MKLLKSYTLDLDRQNTRRAFNAGFSHAIEVSNADSERILRSLKINSTGSAVTAFCEGAHDGAINDTFRLMYESL